MLPSLIYPPLIVLYFVLVLSTSENLSMYDAEYNGADDWTMHF